VLTRLTILILLSLTSINGGPAPAEDSPFFRKPSGAPPPSPASVVPLPARVPAAAPSPSAIPSNPLRKDFYDRDELYLREVKLRP
jgi:hypothetical protein